MSWTGGCACGAVRYTAAAPSMSFHCHCRQCQRATGGGHASAFVVAADTVKITGEMKFFDQPSDRGNIVCRGFCSNCGSPMMNKNLAFPANYYICAATLDDPSQFQPTMALFSDAAQPWDHMDPALD